MLIIKFMSKAMLSRFALLLWGVIALGIGAVELRGEESPVQGSDDTLYHLVRISDASEDDLNAMAELGLPMDDMRQVDSNLEIPLSDRDIELLTDIGISYEIVIFDLEAYYRDVCEANLAALSSDEPLMSTTGEPQPLSAPDVSGNAPTNMGYGSMGGFYNYEEILDVLDDMRSKYPDLITERVSIGTTWQTNSIWMVKISDNADTDEDEPESFVDCLHHAREPGSYTAALYVMWYLLENYGTDPEATYLVDNRELYFVPVVNPDGLLRNEYTNPDGGGMWRKNRRDNGDGTYGVDPNRNYPYQWGGAGSSGDTSSDTYRGPGPGSEPEVQAIMAFSSNHQFKTSLSFHSHGGYFLYPYGYDNVVPEHADVFAEYGEVMSSENQYTYGRHSIVLYKASGNTIDWMLHELDIMAFLPEIGKDGTFWPSVDKIMPDAEDQLLPQLHMFWCAGSKPDALGLALMDEELSPGESEQLALALINEGMGDMDAGVTATLATADPYVTIQKGLWTLDAMDGRETDINTGNPFEIIIAPECPTNHVIEFDVTLSLGGYDIVDSFSIGGDNTAPAAYWKFDETNGVVAADAAGNGHDGALEGSPARVDGRLDGAFSFDEVDDRVTVPDFDYTSSNMFSVAFWFNCADNSGSSFQYIYSHGSVGETNSLNIYFFESGSSLPGILRTYLMDENDSQSYMDIPAGLADGAWHHYALAVDAEEAKVYIDGELQASSSQGGDAFNPATAIYLGGREDGDADRYYGGLLDDVRIYSRPLSLSQVTMLANPGGAAQLFTITATAGANGSIDPDGEALVFKSNDQAFAISPDLGYEIADVLVDGSSVGAVSNYTFTAVTNDHTIAASFAFVPDDEPPSVPQDLSATAISMSQIDLSWSASTDNVVVAGYEIMRDGSYLSDVTGTNYSDTGLSPDTGYSYTVLAYDAATNKSAESSAASATTPEQPDTLVAHWKLDDGSGTNMLDSSGNGHNGTLFGDPQWVTGTNGGALSFDEVGDYATVSDFDYASSNMFSVAFWLNCPDNSGSAFQYIYSHGSVDNQNSLNIYFCENDSSSPGTLRTSLMDSNDSENFMDVAAGLTDGAWHHYALTVSNEGSKVYIDGELQESSGQGGDAFNPATAIYLGGREDRDADRYYGGLLDDVRMYNTALSQADIEAAMNAGTSVTYTITATAGENGSIFPSGDVQVPAGESRSFAMEPDAGCLVDDVLVNGGSVGAVTNYVFSDVMADGTIHATFFQLQIDDLATSMTGSSNGPTLRFTVRSDYTYDVLYKDDLMDTNGWLVLTNDIGGFDGEVEVPDTDNREHRFYRLRAR